MPTDTKTITALTHGAYNLLTQLKRVRSELNEFESMQLNQDRRVDVEIYLEIVRNFLIQATEIPLELNALVERELYWQRLTAKRNARMRRYNARKNQREADNKNEQVEFGVSPENIAGTGDIETDAAREAELAAQRAAYATMRQKLAQIGIPPAELPESPSEA